MIHRDRQSVVQICQTQKTDEMHGQFEQSPLGERDTEEK